MESLTKILVINPNSTLSMTDGLKPLLADLIGENLNIDFYTAPPEAPKSIDDAETSTASTEATLPALSKFLRLSENISGPQPTKYSAFLVSCYSVHSLVPMLRSRVKAPVLGIFEASVIRARALGRPFGIVTTGKYWEKALSEGVANMSKNEQEDRAEEDTSFVGVRSTGLSAAELHSTAREEVDRRIMQASAGLVREGAQVILLGCAGMSGMDEAVLRGARMEGKEVQIIDGVRAGVELLQAWAILEAGTLRA